MSNKNPVEDLVDKVAAEQGVRHAKDLELWHHWNSNGRQPEHLEPLLIRFQPLINQKVREWMPGAMVAPAALEANIASHVVKSFQSYKPDRGASLNTHVNYGIQKGKRFVAQHQNVVSLAEPDAYQVGNIQRAQTQLQEQFGREPTHQELADHMGMPISRVKKIQAAVMKDVPGSAMESDPNPKFTPREQEVLSLLPPLLNERQKRIFDLAYHPTAPVTSTNALAAKTGMSPSQISRIKTQLINMVNQYK